jgi:hypothetical protein
MKWSAYWPTRGPAYAITDWQSVGSAEKLPAYQLMLVAKMIAQSLFEPQASNVFIAPDEVGVWESSEHPHLLERVIGHPGQDDLLGEFSPDERDAAISYIYVMLTFGWGVAAWTGSDDRAVRIDHDGHFASRNLPEGPLKVILDLLGPKPPPSQPPSKLRPPA